MKELFTLIAATFLTVAVFAADHRPTVTLKTSRNYEVVIDGKRYFGNNGFMRLSHLGRGRHTIKVYEVSRGFMYRKVRRMVDASAFRLRNNDVDISIDFRGQISITENRFDHDRWDNRRDNDWDNRHERDRR